MISTPTYGRGFVLVYTDAHARTRSNRTVAPCFQPTISVRMIQYRLLHRLFAHLCPNYRPSTEKYLQVASSAETSRVLFTQGAKFLKGNTGPPLPHGSWVRGPIWGMTASSEQAKYDDVGGDHVVASISPVNDSSLK